MKSLLAIVGGLLLMGLSAHAGDRCNKCCTPVVAHVVHCHTTSCCGHAHRQCGQCGHSHCRVRRCAHSHCGQAHVHVANRPYCRPVVRVKVRRRCLPRVVYYRTCYTSACY